MIGQGGCKSESHLEGTGEIHTYRRSEHVKECSLDKYCKYKALDLRAIQIMPIQCSPNPKN